MAADAGGSAKLAIVAVLAGYMAPALIYDALPPVLPQIARHFGGGHEGEWIAQMCVALAILGTGFGGLAAGPLIARIGLKAAIVCGWLVFAVFGSVGLIAEASELLLASRVLVGIGAGLLLGASTVAIALAFSLRVRPRITGFGLATAAGSAVCFIYAAAAFAQISWRAPFATHAVLALVVVPVVLLSKFPAPAGANRSRPPEVLLRALLALAPTYGLILAMVVAGNLFIVQTTFLLSSRGFDDPALIAQVVSASPIVIGVANLSFGLLEERIGITRCVALALACLAIGALTCGTSSSLPLIVVGVAIGSVGVGFGVPAALVQAMNGCDPRVAPYGVALATALTSFGGFLAPMAYVPLYHAFGYTATYVLVFVAMSVFACAYIMRNRASALVGEG